MDLIAILVIFIAGVFAGRQWMLHTVYKEARNIMTELGLVSSLGSTTKKSNHTIPLYVIERENSTFLLYDLKTRNFVCQGYSVEEVAENLFKHNHVELAYVGFDKQKFWFIDGTVKTDSDLQKDINTV